MKEGIVESSKISALRPELQVLRRRHPEKGYALPGIELYIVALESRLFIPEEKREKLRSAKRAGFKEWMSAVQIMKKDDRMPIRARIGSNSLLLSSDMELPQEVTPETPLVQVLQTQALCLAKLAYLRKETPQITSWFRDKAIERQIRRQLTRLTSRPIITGGKTSRISFKEAITSLDPKKMAQALATATLALAASCTGTPKIIEPFSTEPVASEIAETPEGIPTDISKLPALSETIRSSTEKEDTTESLWGTYPVREANIGHIQELRVVDNSEIGQDFRERITLEAKKQQEIENPQLKVVEVIGQQGNVLLPFMYTFDSNGNIDYRWSVWAWDESGLVPVTSDKLDNLVFVQLGRLAMKDGPILIGPVVDNEVQDFIVFVQNTDWYFIPPYPDNKGEMVPLNREVTDELITRSSKEVISESKINELAEELRCIEGDTCINEVIGNPRHVYFEFISTGTVENIDLTDTNTGKILGIITVLNVVSKDKTGKPFKIKVLLQSELASKPGFNVYPLVSQVVGRMIKRMQGESITGLEAGNDIQSIEQWMEMLPEGSMWTFILPKDGFINEDFLQSTIFTDPRYASFVKEFVESEGEQMNDDLVLIPIGASSRSSGLD